MKYFYFLSLGEMYSFLLRLCSYTRGLGWIAFFRTKSETTLPQKRRVLRHSPLSPLCGCSGYIGWFLHLLADKNLTLSDGPRGK